MRATAHINTEERLTVPGGSNVTQYVLVMTHPPDQCPTANSKIRKLFLSTDIPGLARKSGVKFVAGPLISTEHKSVTVLDAKNVESVRDFVIKSGFIQWNSVEVLPGVSIDEAKQELDSLDPIY